MKPRKPKSGNPKNRASGRVTPKGGHPVPDVQGIKAEAPGAAQAALAAAGHATHPKNPNGRPSRPGSRPSPAVLVARGPRRSVAVHSQEWASKAHRSTVLRGVMAELEARGA